TRIVLVSSPQSWELFAADPRIEHAPVSYLRSGSVAERLAQRSLLLPLLSLPESIVIDPDSRLTQLGLLPVCPEENYFFFESRAYGHNSADSITELARRWAAETFDIADAAPYIAPIESRGDPVAVTVSFGVGDDAAMRLPD